jgi:hypothetical protein
MISLIFVDRLRNCMTAGNGSSAFAQTAGSASPRLFDFGEAHLIDQPVDPDRVEDAIRTEILGQRHATVSNFAVAA